MDEGRRKGGRGKWKGGVQVVSPNTSLFFFIQYVNLNTFVKSQKNGVEFRSNFTAYIYTLLDPIYLFSVCLVKKCFGNTSKNFNTDITLLWIPSFYKVGFIFCIFPSRDPFVIQKTPCPVYFVPIVWVFGCPDPSTTLTHFTGSVFY